MESTAPRATTDASERARLRKEQALAPTGTCSGCGVENAPVFMLDVTGEWAEHKCPACSAECGTHYRAEEHLKLYLKLTLDSWLKHWEAQGLDKDAGESIISYRAHVLAEEYIGEKLIVRPGQGN